VHEGPRRGKQNQRGGLVKGHFPGGTTRGVGKGSPSASRGLTVSHEDKKTVHEVLLRMEMT